MSSSEAIHVSASPDATIGGCPAESAEFIRQAHDIVRDLLVGRPRRYWTDFLVTILITYATFVVYITAASFSALQLMAFVMCGFAMYRAVVFTHEITHRRMASFAAFTFVWNLLCGVPLLVPSFLYGDHKRHHTTQAYGTWADPEYIMRSRHWRTRLVVFLLLPLVYPPAAVLRFLVLTPLALLSSRIDRLVWMFASSLYVMNESYRRDYDAAASTSSRWIQEEACSAWVWLVMVLALTNRVPPSMLFKTYLVVLLWIAINQVRTLVAHRYANRLHEPISRTDQILDSNTFPYQRCLPELWAPLGLRYHALHHLFPTLPYHAMRDAHDRLMMRLPGNSPYHQTVRRGLWPVLAETLRGTDLRGPRPQVPVAASPMEGRQGVR